MKKINLFGLAFLCANFVSFNAHAGLELVCEGMSPNTAHKTVWVNCDSRKEVIDILGAAWKTLRDERIGGTLEDMCWDSYQRAEDMHPSIGMEPGLALNFFASCNQALQYVEGE